MTPASTTPKVVPAARLRGRLTLPADKSIAHRALIFGALSGGPTTVTMRSPGRDVLSTLACLRALGVSIEETDGRYVITGRPSRDADARLRQLGHHDAPARGGRGGPPAAGDARRRRVAARPADGARRHPASGGRCGGDDHRWPRAADGGGTSVARGRRPSPSGRQRAATRSRRPCRAERNRRDGDRHPRSDPRPHRAHAGLHGRADLPRGPHDDRDRSREADGRSSWRCPATPRPHRPGWWPPPFTPTRS